METKEKRKHPVLKVLLWLIVIAAVYRVASLSDSASTSQATASPAPTSSIYADEITFQDYQWGVDAKTVSEQTGFLYFEGVTPDWSTADNYLGAATYSLGYQVYNIGDVSLGGYEVNNFYMYFSYGHDNGKISLVPENSELYMVSMDLDIADVEATYTDLYNKLSDLYGDCTVSTYTGFSTSTDGSFHYTTTSAEWLGQNNTAVMLTKRVPEDGAPDSISWIDNYVVLSYGKTDSKDTLSALNKEYIELQKDIENSTRDTSNNSGL
jgi:hypothetical protein